MTLLRSNSQFADYGVVRKLSTRYDGEREVYLARYTINVVDAWENQNVPEGIISTVHNRNTTETQQKIAETFAEAEKKSPMILILDELDALVPKRDAEINENQTNEVSEMLTQLNNCAERGIFCLCTTNRPERIDPAVMRKGCVDRSTYIPTGLRGTEGSIQTRTSKSSFR